MAKFPEPPSSQALAQRLEARVHLLPAGFPLWRIYARSVNPMRAWFTFRHYGPVRSARFDHHLAPPREQARAIHYAAASAVTCVAEVFQDTRIIDTTNPNLWLVGLETARDLRLLDLSGTWPTSARASMAMGSGQRSWARRWSQAIYGAYPEVEGLWYCSSMHANKPAVALYERAASAIPVSPYYHKGLSDPLLRVVLENAAVELGYEIV